MAASCSWGGHGIKSSPYDTANILDWNMKLYFQLKSVYSGSISLGSETCAPYVLDSVLNEGNSPLDRHSHTRKYVIDSIQRW